jgi:NADH-quinone oxidoreductase subunit C
MSDTRTPDAMPQATLYATSPEAIQASLATLLGEQVTAIKLERGEVTLTVPAANYLAVMTILRDAPQTRFEQLIDLCGVDYQDYGDGTWEGQRFAAVVHLLSVSLNHRVRVRVFCPEDDFPVLPSVTSLWASANWYEREAFDLFGIVFDGHNDLRRILTDYGFIGHPFRKDFPLSGHVEMRYDATRQRVVYEPVSIEPRELIPRVIREENYGGLN